MNNYDAALNEAIDRDLDEQQRLTYLADLVAGWLDALIPELGELRHPDARWSPGDLADDLRAHADSIRRELHRVSHGPIVMDDW